MPQSAPSFLIGAALEDYVPIEGTRQRYEETKRIFKIAGVPNSFAKVETPGPQALSESMRETCYSWMLRRLAGETGDTSEPEFGIEIEQGLRCAANPRHCETVGRSILTRRRCPISAQPPAKASGYLSLPHIGRRLLGAGEHREKLVHLECAGCGGSWMYNRLWTKEAQTSGGNLQYTQGGPELGLKRVNAKITRRQCLAVCGLSAFAQDIRAQATVDSEIRRLSAEAPLSMEFHGSTKADCERWQRTFDAKLRELLGPFDPPARWDTVRERIVDCGDYSRDELILRAKGHRDLPVYLLTPKETPKGTRAGLLALHGHGDFGYDAVAGIDTTPERRKDIADQHYDYGVKLVHLGYTVAAPCFTPFGRRLDDPKSYKGEDPCAITFLRMQLLGQLLMAENLRDALWALELLAAQPHVDTVRLGCVGLSTGGRMTMLTSALSPRIRVAVISGALNVMQERIGLQRYSCGAQVIPGLLKYGDVPEIASLIAPRPILWEVGLQDPLMVKDWIPPALARIERAYKAYGVPENVDVDYFEGKHRWNGVKAYPLLARVLRP